MLDWKLLAGAAGIVAAVVFVIWLIFFCARRIREHLKGRELDAMEGHDFEYFCADLLEDHGFKSVEVTRGSGDLLTDRSFLMPKTTKSDKNEQPEIMKDQEEFYYGIFSERSRNFTDICDRTGSRYWNLEFNQGKGVNITVRREYSMN